MRCEGPGTAGREYDVSRDDRQFLVVTPLDAYGRSDRSLTIVTHWFDAVRAAMKGK
jgi:hypothetical protein